MRHAPVVVDTDVPAREWRLSADGRALAERLGEWPRWRRVAAVASSPEPKAVATAEPIAAAAGAPVEVVDDLREVARPGTPVMHPERYAQLAMDYLAGARVGEWEPAHEARERFERAVTRVVAASEGDVAVVSHGLVLSLYLRLTPAEWRRIALPAVAAVDASSLRVVAPFASVEELPDE